MVAESARSTVPARFGAARAQGIKEWQGKGIVAVLQPGADYSVWFFETSNGRRDSFYVNIEVPFTRLERGIGPLISSSI